MEKSFYSQFQFLWKKCSLSRYEMQGSSKFDAADTVFPNSLAFGIPFLDISYLVTIFFWIVISKFEPVHYTFNNKYYLRHKRSDRFFWFWEGVEFSNASMDMIIYIYHRHYLINTNFTTITQIDHAQRIESSTRDIYHSHFDQEIVILPRLKNLDI